MTPLPLGVVVSVMAKMGHSYVPFSPDDVDVDATGLQPLQLIKEVRKHEDFKLQFAQPFDASTYSVYVYKIPIPGGEPGTDSVGASGARA